MTEPVDDRIMWVDIETTGLDPLRDVILEIGLVCTNNDGSKTFGEKSWLVHDKSPQYDKAIENGKKHEIVGPMHEESGLWKDLVEIHTATGTKKGYTHLTVAKEIRHFFAACKLESGSVVMASNSPSGVDRPFLSKQLPEVHELFHYRTIDVSSIKEACRRLNPRVFESFSKPDGNHRVMGDIAACIAEWQFYIDEFLYVTYGE